LKGKLKEICILEFAARKERRHSEVGERKSQKRSRLIEVGGMNRERFEKEVMDGRSIEKPEQFPLGTKARSIRGRKNLKKIEEYVGGGAHPQFALKKSLVKEKDSPRRERRLASLYGHKRIKSLDQNAGGRHSRKNGRRWSRDMDLGLKRLRKRESRSDTISGRVSK